MFFDIKQLEREKYEDKFKVAMVALVIEDNYYRFVLRDWFNFKQNKYKLNDLWHSFLVCTSGSSRFLPHDSFLVLPIKNIKYGSITFNGIKNKKHINEYKYSLEVGYLCLYNKWYKYNNNLQTITDNPRNSFRLFKQLIDMVEEENKLEQICKC